MSEVAQHACWAFPYVATTSWRRACQARLGLHVAESSCDGVTGLCQAHGREKVPTYGGAWWGHSS